MRTHAAMSGSGEVCGELEGTRRQAVRAVRAAHVALSMALYGHLRRTS